MTYYIALCEQTHPRCQGFACDDHIDKRCYVVTPDATQAARIDSLLQRIDEKAEQDMRRREAEWQEQHPGEECTGEGEEFVGATWVEHQKVEGDEGDTPADEIIRKLKRQLQAD